MRNEVANVYLCLFDTIIGDIYRAIRGRSLLGAFTLSMCAIDAMAHLGNADEQGRIKFEHWAETWMCPLNNHIEPEVLYAIRCGLVHTHGVSERMKKIREKSGMNFTHNNPDQHWKRVNNCHYTLNLESHVAEVTIAAVHFFRHLAEEADDGYINGILTRAKDLLYVRLYTPDGTRIIRPDYFANIDAAMSLLDQPEPTVGALVQSIRRIYPENQHS